jgi:hypothetical protein
MPLPQTASRSAKGFSATASWADYPADFNLSTRSREVTSMSRNFLSGVEPGAHIRKQVRG